MAKQMILRSEGEVTVNEFKTVGEYMWNKLNELNDDFVGMIDALTGERMTIGELKRQSNSISMALLNRGIDKADRIAFSGPNSIQHTVLRFVSYFLGNTFLPLSPTFEKYEVEQEYEFAQANIIMTSQHDLYKFEKIIADSVNNNKKNVKMIVVFDGNTDKFLTFGKLLEEGRDRALERIPHFDINTEKDMLFLIHTSGSTGRPKCAMIPHKVFLQRASNSAIMKGLVTVGIVPFGHIGGTATIPHQIINGSTVVLFGHIDEELLIKSIEKYRINIMAILPNVGRKFVEGDFDNKYDFSSLKVVVTWGAAFPANIAKALVDKYNIKFREAYGMTEYIGATIGADPNDPLIPGNLGRVAPGTELKIVDLKTGESLGPNIDGEIYVRGNKMFAGYLNNPKATAEAIDSEGWYRTGDIGHYDQKERIFITDRIKEVLRIGIDNHLINISPVEIEQFLLTHKSIAEVAVIGVNNSKGNQWPRAYVVLKEGQTATESEIQKFVSDTLAYTKQLKGGVVFIKTIRRTSAGKVDRKYFRSLVTNEVIN